MQLGIFESVLMRSTLAETFQAVANRGFSAVQFDLASAGLDSLPLAVDSATVSEIRAAADAAGVTIAAVSGTFNMAQPNPGQKQANLKRFRTVVSVACALGSPVVTLCTGTRDLESMWRFHPDNATEEAWRDFRETLDQALVMAAEANVVLGVEPEPANVISSAKLARKLLDEVGSDHLRIIFDPANIVLSDRTREPAEVLDEAFAWLGSDIVHAHAKDLSADDEFCAAGTGIVPWKMYQQRLDTLGYEGPVIFHTLKEADIDRALAVFS